MKAPTILLGAFDRHNFGDLLLAMNLNPLIHSDNDARIVARELLLAHREHLPTFAAAIDALA